MIYTKIDHNWIGQKSFALQNFLSYPIMVSKGRKKMIGFGNDLMMKQENAHNIKLLSIVLFVGICANRKHFGSKKSFSVIEKFCGRKSHKKNNVSNFFSLGTSQTNVEV